MSYDNLFWGDTTIPNHSQWRIKAESLLADRDLFHPTATKYFPLGALAESRDGRLFRYVEAAAAECPKAAMTQSSAPVANWLEQVQTNNPDVWAVGDKLATVTLTSTAVAHDFIDGWLMVQDVTTAAISDMYLIKDNAVGTANLTTGYDIVLEIADTGGIRTAIVAATDVTVIKNKYKDVIVVPAAAATNAPVGVPLVSITASYYGWVQTRGPCPLLIDTDTVVVGDQVGEPDDTTVAGGAGIHAVTFPIYGIVLSKPTNTQTDQPAIVDLCIE
ncbi:MAG: hypothetical protein ACYSSI_00050 [Planctomycetota bacterium]